MTRDEFRKRAEDSGCADLALELHSPSSNSRKLTPENFEFFEELRRYLISAMTAAIGQYTAIGGVFDDTGANTVTVGWALDEKVIFLGKFLLWASGFNFNVRGYELDFLPATDGEKKPVSSVNSVPLTDVAGNAATVFFVESYEKVKDRIKAKYGDGWFNNWPEIFRIAYLIRNAFAHDGKWQIQDQKNREHYQTEVFHWARARMSIQMRDGNGGPVDEGRDVLSYVNGADLIVFAIEMSDELKR
jgi:hypothetical protein